MGMSKNLVSANFVFTSEGLRIYGMNEINMSMIDVKIEKDKLDEYGYSGRKLLFGVDIFNLSKLLKPITKNDIQYCPKVKDRNVYCYFWLYRTIFEFLSFI